MGGHGVAEGRRVARQEDEHGCLKVVWKFWEHQGSQEFESGCLSIVRICMFLAVSPSLLLLYVLFSGTRPVQCPSI